MKFLQHIAEYLIENHASNLEDVTVVLPNKRAGIFLKKYLSEKTLKPIWSPNIISTEDLVSQLSGKLQLDELSLSMEFYKVYLDLEGENAEAFEDFSYWANVLLADYNEIDRYLVNTQKFFSYLKSAKQMETWSPDGKELTELQENYIRFWEKMGDYYYAFHNHLDKNNFAYHGKVYRYVAENIESEEIVSEIKKMPHIIFAGFNALTKAEEKIIDHLSVFYNAKAFWDVDEYYLNDVNQEAGLFARNNKKKFFRSTFISDNGFKNVEKTINVYGITGNIAQVKYVAEILNQLNDFEDTAVVLADEKLLPVVLQSIPKKVEKFNVTMGYPLQFLPAYSFFDSLFKLYINYGRYRRDKFHYTDVLAVLNNKYFNLFNQNEEALQHLLKRIKNNNLLFLSVNEFDKGVDIKLFQLALSPVQFLNNLVNIISELKDVLIEKDKEGNVYEIEYLYRFSTLFKQLTNYAKKYHFVDSIKVLYTIFRTVVRSEKIDYYGEPLSGLQIMGILETRLLDFKNVILLSVNEGNLPAGKTQNSFIPYDFKKDIFNLPTHYEKDAIFAYHFYRLIQRAENVSLLYNNDKAIIGSNEKSRFLLQLEDELKKANGNHIINLKQVSIGNTAIQSTHKFVKSDEQVIQKLIQKFESGVSPSFINNYINCPFDFYHTYILGLREEDEVEEKIEANTFGNIIHQSLEKLYTPYLNQMLLPENILKMEKELLGVIKNEFKEKFGNYYNQGKNLLAFHAVKEYVSIFLQKEKQLVQSNELIIKGLEQELNYETQLGELPLKLKGKIDRIDALNGQLRIIDYKTGRVDDAKLNVKNADKFFEKSDYKIALQLMFYRLLAQKNYPEFEAIPAVISFKEISKEPSVLKGEISDEIIYQFEENLYSFLSQLIQPDLIFEHNQSSNYCKYCY